MILPARFTRAVLALAIVLAATLPVHAQGLLGMLPEPADEHMREALEASYARSFLKEQIQSSSPGLTREPFEERLRSDAALRTAMSGHDG